MAIVGSLRQVTLCGNCCVASTWPVLRPSTHSGRSTGCLMRAQLTVRISLGLLGMLQPELERLPLQRDLQL